MDQLLNGRQDLTSDQRRQARAILHVLMRREAPPSTRPNAPEQAVSDGLPREQKIKPPVATAVTVPPRKKSPVTPKKSSPEKAVTTQEKKAEDADTDEDPENREISGAELYETICVLLEGDRVQDMEHVEKFCAGLTQKSDFKTLEEAFDLLLRQLDKNPKKNLLAGKVILTLEMQEIVTTTDCDHLRGKIQDDD